MATNDKNLAGNKAADLYPGVANPTTSSLTSDPLQSNFVTDPTTDDFGAGAGPNFKGHLNARRNFRETAGVVEAIPGLIESTNIDPLNENSNKDDGWANATVAPGTGSGSSGTGIGSFASGAANTATAIAASAAGVSVGAAQMAYGHAMGDEATKQAGKEAVWGKQ